MKILTVHGLGRQERNPDTWQGGWKDAFGKAIGRWSSTTPLVEHADYDELFGNTPMTVGGTAQGFGRLIWDEVKFSVVDKVSNIWPFRRRAFGEGVSDAVKWKIGMVTQFAEDPALRQRLREHLAAQIDQHKPDIVFAHSLGTILIYNLLLNKPHTSLLRSRTFITAGCQIGRAALRSLFGGRLQMVDVGSWYNLYNRHDDVLVVPLNIFAANYRQIDTHFDTKGVGDHDAIGYILHENAVNTVWRQLALAPKAPARAVGGAQPKATKADVLPVSPTAAVEPKRRARRALLIGINEYPNPDDRLEGCVNDVFKMSAALQQCGFEPEEIRTVLNERATAAGIRERYTWLLDDPQPDDIRVLFFSGHGAQIPDYGSDETVDHKDETLVAYDFDWNDRATHLTDDDFNAVYTQLPYDTTFIAFFDCCHSGGLTRMGGAKVRGLNPPDDIRHRMLRWNLESQVWEPRELTRKRASRTETYMADRPEYVGEENDTNRMLRGVAARHIDAETYKLRKTKFGHKGPYQPLIFEACQEHDFAYEYRDGVTSYGGYTYFLTQELFAAARERRDITFKQLHDHARKLLGSYFQQTPQLIGPAVLRNAKVPRGQTDKKKSARKPRGKRPGKQKASR